MQLTLELEWHDASGEIIKQLLPLRGGEQKRAQVSDRGSKAQRKGLALYAKKHGTALDVGPFQYK